MAANDDELERLQNQINDAKGAEPDKSSSGLGGAMRLSVELMAGVALGTAAGYFADKWLGTKPWLLILCFFLGTVAGFKNMLREAKKLANEETPKT
jgi:ATP synthase protein I